MFVFLSVLVGSLAAVAITCLLCFKGIVYYKKMEVIPTKPLPIPAVRPVEMDEAERKLNALREQQAGNVEEKKKETAIAPNISAMDSVLRRISDVLGPENPTEE